MRRVWREVDSGLGAPVEASCTRVLDIAFRMHSQIGPGSLESVYRRVLSTALERAGACVEQEVWLPLTFEGISIERALRVDLVVDGHLAVEVKALEEVHPAHRRQLVSYVRAGRFPLGLLLNFGAARLVDGLERVPNRSAVAPP